MHLGYHASVFRAAMKERDRIRMLERVVADYVLRYGATPLTEAYFREVLGQSIAPVTANETDRLT